MSRSSKGKASDFYRLRLYEGVLSDANTSYDENVISSECLNRIFYKSSECMDELPDKSVHLVVTSPPYNVGKEYDANMTLFEYRDFLRRVMNEAYRVLVPGGRLCINIANVGRRPYLPLHAFIIQDLLDIGFIMRGEVIWDKGSASTSSTAWGSWCSPTNPTLRDIHEYILIFSKQTLSRPKMHNRRATIKRDEFLEFTKSVWHIKPESARRIGHPAPFPIELPYRLIKLYTFENEIVLDPFMGSGTTALAALQTNRYFIGYEINLDYIRIAEQRINKYSSNKNSLF
jgi:site-specific DNA-methyltransferase (adenine-specific)